MLVSRSGPTMMARIAVMKALNSGADGNLIGCHGSSVVKTSSLRNHSYWSTMPNSESQPKRLGKDLDCIKCGSKMHFSCIEPHKPGFVHHVYECRNFRSTQSFVTAL